MDSRAVDVVSVPTSAITNEAIAVCVFRDREDAIDLNGIFAPDTASDVEQSFQCFKVFD